MNSVGKPRSLKQSNSRAVFELMRDGQGRTVTEISERIRLSKTTVKKIFDSLLGDGLIRSIGKGDSTEEGGKRPEVYCLNPEFGYVIGIHVTPDEVLTVTTDFMAEIAERGKTGIADVQQLEGLIERFARTIEDTVRLKEGADQRLLGVVLVLTGLVDPDEGVSIHSSFYPEWGRDAPIVPLLKARLGPSFSAPIFVDNTNRYQAIAESEKGLAGAYKNYIIVDALPEGLGGGVVLGGRILHGCQSLSGEIGHMTLDKNGYPCICGHSGCFEAMVSARRIIGLAFDRMSAYPESILATWPTEPAFTLDDICVGAAAGDPLCRALIDDVAEWYVVGLGNMIMMNDPELIVLQGIYTKAGPYFLERIQEGLKHIGLPHVEKRVTVAYSQLGEERGLVGGALHVIARYLANHVY